MMHIASNTLAMNTLRFDENCFIRSLVHNGKKYLSSRDICSILGYSNVSQELNKRCRPDYIVELKDIAFNPDISKRYRRQKSKERPRCSRQSECSKNGWRSRVCTNYLVAAKSQKLRHFRSGCTKK